MVLGLMQQTLLVQGLMQQTLLVQGLMVQTPLSHQTPLQTRAPAAGQAERPANPMPLCLQQHMPVGPDVLGIQHVGIGL